MSQRAFLGSDVSLVDGDFVVDAGGDLAIVAGLDCLKQDIANRLQTGPGGLFLHPSFGDGLPDMVGRVLGEGDLEDVASAARLEVLKDARVADVVATAWRDEDDQYKVWLRLELTLASGQQVGNLVFPFQIGGAE